MRTVHWLFMGILILFLVSCSKLNDEQQLKNLVKKNTEAWNKKDYHTLYEMQSPNFRANVSYETYKDFVQSASGVISLYLGSGKIKTSDIHVNVRGEWGYVSYKIKKGKEIIDSVDEDIFRKVKGKWYDVEESPIMPGYNREDLPPDKK